MLAGEAGETITEGIGSEVPICAPTSLSVAWLAVWGVVCVQTLVAMGGQLDELGRRARLAAGMSTGADLVLERVDVPVVKVDKV